MSEPAIPPEEMTLDELRVALAPLLPAEAAFDGWSPVALARAAEAPGRGFHWGGEAHHADLPRGERVAFPAVGTMREILFGPSRVADGTMNLIGALTGTLIRVTSTEPTARAMPERLSPRYFAASVAEPSFSIARDTTASVVMTVSPTLMSPLSIQP